MKKFFTGAGIAFLVFFVAFRPGPASDAVGKLLGVILDVANGFAEFFGNLFGG